MAQQVVADRRDVDFVLHEQLHVERLSENERFEDFNKKTSIWWFPRRKRPFF